MAGRALGDPRARRPDRQARPRGGRADLARGRAGERAAGRRAAAEPAPGGGAGSGARTRSTAPSASPRRRPTPDGGAARADASLEAARGDRRRGALGRASTPTPGAEAAAGDELNAYLWRGRGRRRATRSRSSGPLQRHPGRGQGHLLHRGRADHRRLAHPRGLPAALHRDRRAAPARGRRAGARQDQHGRVRDGLLERELRLRAGAQPVGPRARPRRLLGRLGGGRRRRPRALRDRHRHRRLDPPAGGALRDRRAEAHLRGDLALRDDRLRLLARPVRAADPRRHRRGAAAGGSCRGATPATRPRSGSRAGSSLPEPRGPRAACASGCPASSAATASTPACARSSRRRWRGSRSLGGEIAEVVAAAAPSTASPPTT